MTTRAATAPRLWARALVALAAIGGLLSLTSLLDYYMNWGLCSGDGCQDPRWKQFGSLGGLPLAGLGMIIYALMALLAIRVRQRVASSTPSRPQFVLPLLSGVAVGAHGYLIWVQAGMMNDCSLRANP